MSAALSGYIFNNKGLIAQNGVTKETSLDFCDKGLKCYGIIFLFFRIEFGAVENTISWRFLVDEHLRKLGFCNLNN